MTRNALKTAETVDGALAPALTPWDLRVLKATPPVPEGWDHKTPFAISPWRIAEAVREDDVTYVRKTLRGMQDRYLVTATWGTERKPVRWYRTHEGDRYVGAHG